MKLLEKGVCNIHHSTKEKRNIVHYIVNRSIREEDTSFEIERMVFDKGVNSNVVDVYNRSPLHYAFINISNEKKTLKNDPIELVSTIFNLTKIDANL